MSAEKVPDLQVKVFSPFEVFYEGSARALSANNVVGKFDVLPNHTNFMTLLTAGEVSVLTGVDERRFKIAHGVLKVDRNKVVVFANI